MMRPPDPRQRGLYLPDVEPQPEPTEHELAYALAQLMDHFWTDETGEQRAQVRIGDRPVWAAIHRLAGEILLRETARSVRLYWRQFRYWDNDARRSVPWPTPGEQLAAVVVLYATIDWGAGDRIEMIDQWAEDLVDEMLARYAVRSDCA